MPYEFAEVRIKGIQVGVFPDPLIQPVDTVGVAEIMDPRLVPKGVIIKGDCFVFKVLGS